LDFPVDSLSFNPVMLRPWLYPDIIRENVFSYVWFRKASKITVTRCSLQPSWCVGHVEKVLWG